MRTERSFFVVSSFMKWRLDNRYQRHVRISRDCDRAESSVGASILVTRIAVGPSAPPMMPIDAAASGREAERQCAQECRENAKLSGGSEQQALRVGDKRGKVRHGAHAHEDERRV
jgi:hypothetical protein